jgi:hypothetical protein
MVQSLVRAHPDLTAVELWQRASEEMKDELYEMQEVRRRLTDLLHAGRVRQGESRECTVKGSQMVTWRLAEG